MTMFNLKEVEEITGGNNQTYIRPGILHDVIISKWVKGESINKKTPYIGLQLVTREGKKANIDPRQFEFYITEKSQSQSISKIKHIVTKVIKEEEFSSKSPNSIEEFVEHLNDISKGCSLRFKFAGEEYLNSNNEIKTKALLGFPPFAEAINEGAEFEPVSDSETKLTYDENNKYDFKRLPKPTDESDMDKNVVSFV